MGGSPEEGGPNLAGEEGSIHTTAGDLQHRVHQLILFLSLVDGRVTGYVGCDREGGRVEQK